MKIKYKKALLSLLLAIILPSQNACGRIENNENQTQESLDSFESLIKAESTPPLREETNIEESEKTDYESLELKQKKEIADSYLSYYDNYEPEYYYEEYLLTKEDVQQIVASTTNNEDCDFVFDYDLEKIKEIIKNNSKEYIKEHPEFILAFIDETYYYEMFIPQMFFEIEFANALEEIVENNTNNLNEDFHRMQTLKIFYGDTSLVNEDESRYKVVYDVNDTIILGYYNEEENIMVLGYESLMISAEQKIEDTEEEKSPEDLEFEINENFKEELFFTISHELNHLRQSMCGCRDANKHADLCYEDSVMTLIEASAESELYNLDKTSYYDRTTYDYTYFFERADEVLLMLIALAKNESNLDDYYNAINDTDLKSLLDFYGLETDDDIYKFYKVLNIIDGLNYRSNLPYTIYKDETEEKTFGYFQKDIGYAYRNEIFAMALNNLVEYTYENEDFSLEDNIMIFNVIKNQVAKFACTWGKTTAENGEEIYDNIYDPSFVTQLVELENSYVSFLAEYYGVLEKDVRDYEEDIYFYGRYLSRKVNRKDYDNCYYKEEYAEASDKLLERFPVLRAILLNSGYYEEDYNELLSDNQELILKKTIN